MEDNKKFIESLRLLADFYETRPELKLPELSIVNVFFHTKAGLVDAIANIGACEKVGGDSWFALRKWFGRIALDFNIDRDRVCEARVVGKRIVKKQVPVAPVEYREEEVEEDIIEWDCKSLLNGKEAQS